jgi:hypothetical protein
LIPGGLRLAWFSRLLFTGLVRAGFSGLFCSGLFLSGLFPSGLFPSGLGLTRLLLAGRLSLLAIACLVW